MLKSIVRKRSLNIQYEWFGKRSVNYPDSKLHVLIQLTASTKFCIIDNNTFCFWKIPCFNLFPYKSIEDQIWPCLKTGQGQPKDIIWTHLVVLEYSMLRTKFQGHQPFGSLEEDFKGFYHLWAWRPSWSCDLNYLNKLSFPYSKEAPHKIWLQSA